MESKPSVSKNDVQRLFLQAVFSRGVLSEKLAMVIWAKCKDAVRAAAEGDINLPDNNSKNFEEFRAQITASIDALELEFKNYEDEETGRAMYAMVNKKGDAIAQMATDYSPPEIAFFKAVVEQIMLAPREAYSVSSFAALREVNSLKTNMTKNQAENVLGSFVAKGWLLKSSRGRYSLSTRTVQELLKYLTETYGEDSLLKCKICKDVVTRGVACHTVDCESRLHYHCFKKNRKTRSDCPSCQADWPAEIGKPLVPVGEGAVKDGDDNRRRSRKVDTPDGSDEDEDMEEDEASHSQPNPTQTQKKKGKGKARAASKDSDDEE